MMERWQGWTTYEFERFKNTDVFFLGKFGASAKYD